MIHDGENSVNRPLLEALKTALFYYKDYFTIRAEIETQLVNAEYNAEIDDVSRMCTFGYVGSSKRALKPREFSNQKNQ